ncbi:MAG: 7TM domain-containing protein [Candidatus Paceibacterota bacterium]
MKKFLLSLLIASASWMVFTQPAIAQNFGSLEEIIDASPASEATEGSLASASAEAEQRLQDKKDQDITETGGSKKSKLVAFLDEHPIGALSWHNPLQHAIRQAVANGLPANILVLLLLFPLIASIIAASRHVIGLKGFGVYIPAVLSVAFVSTGIGAGLIIFLAVLIASSLARFVVRHLKLPFLPRTAMILWIVSFLIAALLIVSSWLGFSSLLTLNIFPLLIIILLTENFMSTQLFNSQKEALSITFETLIIAVGCALLINLESVQQIVLLYPELSLLGVAAINLLVGKYTGLRLLERTRFQSIIEEE